MKSRCPRPLDDGGLGQPGASQTPRHDLRGTHIKNAGARLSKREDDKMNQIEGPFSRKPLQWIYDGSRPMASG